MQLVLFSATWALLIISASSQAISARQANFIDIILEGDELRNYSFDVPDDGSTVPAPTSQTVYSILTSAREAAKCAFVTANGTVSFAEMDEKVDITPQQQLISVTCCSTDDVACLASEPTPSSSTVPFFSPPAMTVSSTFAPPSISTTTSLALGDGTATYPPYPTGTGSGSGIGSAGPTASSNPDTGSSRTTGTSVAFSGDAVKIAKSLGGPIFALASLFLAL